MSRQHGRRERPKPEQEAYIRSLKRGRRARARERAGVATGPMRITMNRRWAAVAVSTFLLVFAFGSLLTAIFEADEGNTANARLASILAAVLGVFSLTFLGVVSRGRRPLRTTLVTGPLAVGVFMLLGGLLREPASPMVAAFGIAGAITMRPAPGAGVRGRITVVLFAGAAMALAYRLSPTVAVSLAPLLPYFLLMATDIFASRRSGVPLEEVVVVEEEGEE